MDGHQGYAYKVNYRINIRYNPYFYSPHVARASFVGNVVLTELKTKYGKRAYGCGVGLMHLMAELKTADTKTNLTRVNEFFNRYACRSDEELWQKEDHWATPTEFIGRVGGDCEDYVISKYFVLR